MIDKPTPMIQIEDRLITALGTIIEEKRPNGNAIRKNRSSDMKTKSKTETSEETIAKEPAKVHNQEDIQLWASWT